MPITTLFRGRIALLLLAALLAAAPVAASDDAPGEKVAAKSEEGAPSGKGKEGGAPQGPPPALVVTAKASSGLVQPQLQYVGTIYFPEVSQVAAEVQGRVEEYFFEEGRPVTKGQKLVKLNTDLVEKDLQTARFEHKNLQTQLANAKRELERIRALYDQQTVAEQDYDKAYYLVAGLESRATALEAKSARLDLQLEKSTVEAPFDGIVLRREADRGEWLNPGSSVATVARNDVVDVLVHVPQEVLPYLSVGMKLPVEAAGREIQAEVHAIIPEGDVATRTFPVKLRAKYSDSLAQGMEARIRVPAGHEQQAVLVPRDAVLMNMGQTSVWAVFGDKAVNIPVEVTAYQGQEAAVRSLTPETQLQEGMQVVVKGNERLRPGQNVKATGQQDGPPQKAAPAEKPEQ